MVTDVFPALALGMNKESENVMYEKPRKRNESIINAKHWISIVVYAICISLSILALMFYAYSLGLDAIITNNLVFYTLVFTQLVHVFNLPNRHQSIIFNQITTKQIYLARNTDLYLDYHCCLLPTYGPASLKLRRNRF